MHVTLLTLERERDAGVHLRSALLWSSEERGLKLLPMEGGKRNERVEEKGWHHGRRSVS